MHFNMLKINAHQILHSNVNAGSTGNEIRLWLSDIKEFIVINLKRSSRNSFGFCRFSVCYSSRFFPQKPQGGH